MLEDIYYKTIIPSVTYCIAVWGTSSDAGFKGLEHIHARAARTVKHLEKIQEDLLHHYCSLSAPSGACLKDQMTSNECKKTKDIANLRIHVERVINRIKTYRILKNVLPIT